MPNMAPPKKKRGNQKSVKVAIRTIDDKEDTSSDESEDKAVSTEEEAKTLENRKRRKTSDKTHIDSNSQLLKSNTYASLDNINTDAQLKSKTTLSKIKPIIVENTDYNIIQNYINNKELQQKILFKKKGLNYLLYCSTIEDKMKTLELLKRNNTPFFTFSQKEDKSLLYVLKNHYFLEADDLLQILKTEGLPAIKISFLKKCNDNPYYIVHFNKDSIDFTTLNNKYKTIQSLIVKWEKFNKTTKKATQCYNCQMYGHSSSNCGKPSRCVKCLESHERGNCKRTTKEGNPQCVNCQQQHAANSKSCEYYIKYKEKISKKIKPLITQRTFTSTPAPWTTNNSLRNFPNLTNNSPNTNNTNRNNSQSLNSNKQLPSISQNDVHNSSLSLFDLLNEFKAIPDIKKTMEIYRELITKLKSTDDHMKRISILITYGLEI